MSDITARIAEILPRHRYTGCGHCRCGATKDHTCIDQTGHDIHVANAIAEELMSWDFLMLLLDQHYPESLFPTLEDRNDRDPGPRIVSLIRVIDQLRGTQ